MNNIGVEAGYSLLQWGFHREQLLSIGAACLIALFYGLYRKVKPMRKNIFHAILCGLISAQVYLVSNKLMLNNIWIDFTGVITSLVGVDYIHSVLTRMLDFLIRRLKAKFN